MNKISIFRIFQKKLNKTGERKMSDNMKELIKDLRSRPVDQHVPVYSDNFSANAKRLDKESKDKASKQKYLSNFIKFTFTGSGA